MNMNLRCGFATLDIWCRMGSIKCMEAFGVLGCYRLWLHLRSLEASRLFFNQSKTVWSIDTNTI